MNGAGMLNAGRIGRAVVAARKPSPKAAPRVVRARQGVSPSSVSGAPKRRETAAEVWSGAKGTNATPSRPPARRKLVAAKPNPKPRKPPVRRPVDPAIPKTVRQSALSVAVPVTSRPAQVRSPKKVRETDMVCKARPEDNRPKPGGSGGRKFVPWKGTKYGC